MFPLYVLLLSQLTGLLLTDERAVLSAICLIKNNHRAFDMTDAVSTDYSQQPNPNHS
jgi:hypothetical protein